MVHLKRHLKRSAEDTLTVDDLIISFMHQDIQAADLQNLDEQQV